MNKLTPNEYTYLHSWVRKHYTKTGTCEHCKLEKVTEWSNRSGNYARERIDWQELCKKCHYKYDNEVFGAWDMVAIGKLGGSVRGVKKGFALNRQVAVGAGRKGGGKNLKRAIVLYQGREYYQADLAKILGITVSTIAAMAYRHKNKYDISFPYRWSWNKHDKNPIP